MKDTLKNIYKKESEVSMDSNFELNLRKRLGNQMEMAKVKSDDSEMESKRLITNTNHETTTSQFGGSFWLTMLSVFVFILGGIITYNFYIGNLSSSSDEVTNSDEIEIKITASQAKQIFQKQIDITEDKSKVYYFKTLEKEPYNPGLTIQNEYLVETWIDQETGSYKKTTKFRDRVGIEVSNLGGFWKYSPDTQILEEAIYPTPLSKAVQTSSLTDLLKVLIDTSEFKFNNYDKDKNLICTTIKVDDFQQRQYFFDRNTYDLRKINISVRQNTNLNYNLTQSIEVLEQKFVSRELVDIASVFNIMKSDLGNYTTVVKSPTPSVSITPNLATKKLKIYFLSMTKFNEFEQTDYLSERFRYTTRVDVATFILEELIKGPLDSEKNEGEKLKGLINLKGDSNCGGKDFTISIRNGIATINWCRDIDLISVGDTQQLALFESIEKSLKQFSTIQKVQIFNKNGQCLNDSVSGINRCE